MCARSRVRSEVREQEAELEAMGAEQEQRREAIADHTLWLQGREMGPPHDRAVPGGDAEADVGAEMDAEVEAFLAGIRDDDHSETKLEPEPELQPEPQAKQWGVSMDSAVAHASGPGLASALAAASGLASSLAEDVQLTRELRDELWRRQLLSLQAHTKPPPPRPPPSQQQQQQQQAQQQPQQQAQQQQQWAPAEARDLHALPGHDSAAAAGYGSSMAAGHPCVVGAQAEAQAEAEAEAEAEVHGCGPVLAQTPRAPSSSQRRPAAAAAIAGSQPLQLAAPADYGADDHDTDSLSGALAEVVAEMIDYHQAEGPLTAEQRVVLCRQQRRMAQLQATQRALVAQRRALGAAARERAREHQRMLEGRAREQKRLLDAQAAHAQVEQELQWQAQLRALQEQVQATAEVAPEPQPEPEPEPERAESEDEAAASDHLAPAAAAKTAKRVGRKGRRQTSARRAKQAGAAQRSVLQQAGREERLASRLGTVTESGLVHRHWGPSPRAGAGSGPPTAAALSTLRRNLRSASYGPRGQSAVALLQTYDRSRLGRFDAASFRALVRKAGKLSAAQCSEAEVARLFSTLLRTDPEPPAPTASEGGDSQKRPGRTGKSEKGGASAVARDGQSLEHTISLKALTAFVWEGERQQSAAAGGGQPAEQAGESQRRSFRRGVRKARRVLGGWELRRNPWGGVRTPQRRALPAAAAATAKDGGDDGDGDDDDDDEDDDARQGGGGWTLPPTHAARKLAAAAARAAQIAEEVQRRQPPPPPAQLQPPQPAGVVRGRGGAPPPRRSTRPRDSSCSPRSGSWRRRSGRAGWPPRLSAT
eukprot:COSAG01_NODE_2949_length_6803_cov_11.790784_5_plen_818_part_00